MGNPKIIFNFKGDQDKKEFRRSKSSNILAPRSFIILIVIGAVFISGFFNIKYMVSQSISSILNELPGLKQAIPELNTREVVESLKVADKEIKNIESGIKKTGFNQVSALLKEVMPTLSGLPEVIKSTSILSEKALSLGVDIDYLKNNSLQLIVSKRGSELIDVLKRVDTNLRELTEINTNLKNQLFSLREVSKEASYFYDLYDDNYIFINFNIVRTQKALDYLISILESGEEQHLLLIFQNETEIRPAGGFIGSYGDLVIQNGNLKDIRIDDIYNADRQLSIKSIPPKELRGVTIDWGARDANWFFDFPKSADKVIYFLENADLHKNNDINFYGALAINTDVLRTIINIVGPIEIAEYDMVLNSDNFLEELQYEVEAGKDKIPGQNPKKVLSVFAPLLLEELKSLDESQKQELVMSLKNHFERKDIMTYFKDWRLQGLLEDLGVAGRVSQLDEDFNGDYLAIINTNVAGGKTDAFIGQEIVLETELFVDGRFVDTLKIKRSHSGENEEEWWYNIKNKNYIKILSPLSANLISVYREDELRGKTSRTYSSEYEYDSNLRAIEETVKFSNELGTWIGKEENKKSFSTWFDTPAGESRNLEFVYSNNLNKEIKDGMKYLFIFDKQSGVDGSLNYSISAPAGYIWKESGRQIFEYFSNDLLGKEIISLTLKELVSN